MTYLEILTILSKLPEERQRELRHGNSFKNINEYIEYLKLNKVL